MEKNRISVLNDVDLIVSKRFREKRILLGLTQKEVGQAIGVSIQQIQKYEKGVNRISSGHLYNISVFFRTQINYFFEESIHSLPEKISLIEEKRILSLLSAFSNLEDMKAQNAVISMIKLMSS